MIATTVWIAFRRLTFSPYADPYGPGFLGDAAAFITQSVGYYVVDAIEGMNPSSWMALLLAAAITLVVAMGIEWGVSRLWRLRKS